MAYYGGKYDIAVIGAGHAGIEAALAAARLGLEVVCFSTSLDAVGNMPCNPSIGGTAKGQLVREIDALGGEMARAADSCCIQFRMLNRGKGPAVYSPRAQVDRQAYRVYMKKALENQRGLHLKQGEVTGIEVENGAVTAVSLSSGLTFKVGAVIMATGTFLKSMTFTGPLGREAGPDGLLPANGLSGCLEAFGHKAQAVQDGHPCKAGRQDGRLFKNDAAKGGKCPRRLCFRRQRAEIVDAVLYDIYKWAHPRYNKGFFGPLAPFHGSYRRGRAPLLPLYRGQGSKVPRKDKAPAFYRALRNEY